MGRRALGRGLGRLDLPPWESREVPLRPRPPPCCEVQATGPGLAPSASQQRRRGQGTSQAWPRSYSDQDKASPRPPRKKSRLRAAHVNPLGQKQNRLANGVWLRKPFQPGLGMPGRGRQGTHVLPSAWPPPQGPQSTLRPQCRQGNTHVEGMQVDVDAGLPWPPSPSPP